MSHFDIIIIIIIIFICVCVGGCMGVDVGVCVGVRVHASLNVHIQKRKLNKIENNEEHTKTKNILHLISFNLHLISSKIS